MRFEDKLIENLDFGRSWLNSSVFEKLFVSYSCIFFLIKQFALRSFYIKMLCFSKIWFLQTFDRSNLFFDQSNLFFDQSNQFFDQSKLWLKFLVWVCLTWLMFDRFSIDCNWKNFNFYVFDQNFFFMHHLCLGFTCIALFLYPSCSFAVISLNVFTHSMHILCYIGYSTWSKNWLINFWAMYHLVYAFFMCEL